MSFAVSGLYVALTALLFMVLTVYVIKMRRRYKVGIGDDGHKPLATAIRVQANLVENAPFALLLFVLAEAGGVPAYALHLFGCVWLIARVLHAFGLIKTNGGIHFGRFWGVILTWAVLLGLSIANIVMFFTA
ncbi:MAPEG family protein [Shewanella intestini]|uniref:MAPEG family protein n=1 Tax=Shewanella intestini TaxID=2017544 RepID=A0ABS5I298_9GAMM|nr:MULTISPECIES: MAPEG family protein [Shewanella]MBR9728156.1 MAPEG family protein [Shewanella intestini]MRG36627.1 MAPEG family protein [Shewanella sp. XMDDZSB0408]